MVKKALCILSGGLDSTLSTMMAIQAGYEVIAIHFNYGQRTERRELRAFREVCDALDIDQRYEIDLPFFSQIGASALTDSAISIPTGGIEAGVPVTYVPFRNGIFLSITSALAEKHHAEALYIGVVEEDSSGYPDCTEEYIQAMEKAINLGTKEETCIEIKMPLVTLSKAQIVQNSLVLGAPLQYTWSCYQSEEEACGLCDSCRLRLRGFEKAGVADPIAYAV